MTNGGRRIATATGAMLADPEYLGNPHNLDEGFLDPACHALRGKLVAVEGGRGSAWFVEAGNEHWVLRHYRRGGFVARWSHDRYAWSGEARVRAFVEWRLLRKLTELKLPVPAPIAASYRRRGFSYRCDLLMQRIVDAQALSALLRAAPIPESSWRAAGATIASFHAAGVDHADLNAHNLLLRNDGKIFLIDFDRGRLRAPGAWAARNLNRLRRSLNKITAGMPPDRFSTIEWAWLLAGYGNQQHHASPL